MVEVAVVVVVGVTSPLLVDEGDELVVGLLVTSGVLVLLVEVLALSFVVGATSPPLSLRTGIRRSECRREERLALPLLYEPPLYVPLLFGDRLTSPPEVVVVVPRIALPLAFLGQLDNELRRPRRPVFEPYEFVLPDVLPTPADEYVPVVPVIPAFACPPAVEFDPVPVDPVVPMLPVVPVVPVVPFVPMVPFEPVVPFVLYMLLVMPLDPAPICPVAHGDVPLALRMLPFEVVPVVCAAALPTMMAPSDTAIPIT